MREYSRGRPDTWSAEQYAAWSGMYNALGNATVTSDDDLKRVVRYVPIAYALTTLPRGRHARGGRAWQFDARRQGEPRRS